MAGNPTWVDGWSPEDLENLVFKRETERKTFAVIAAEMNRPLQTCYTRYRWIVDAREPDSAPSIVAEVPRIPPLHEELGIKTYVHYQAILFDSNGRLGANHSKNRIAHWYREPITLAKVF